MYLPVVMTAEYRIARRSERAYEHLEEAKEAAMRMPQKRHRRLAVIDENNLVHWESELIGREKAIKKSRRKAAQQKS